jgi:hypothetical protein
VVEEAANMEDQNWTPIVVNNVRKVIIPLQLHSDIIIETFSGYSPIRLMQPVLVLRTCPRFLVFRDPTVPMTLHH